MKQNLLVFLDFTKKLYLDRSMLWTMAMRDLKMRYVGSFFGFLWAVFEPLFELTIFGVVFGLFLGGRPDPTYGTDSFFLYLLCGLIPWQFFSGTLNSSTNSILANENLVKKAVGFPSEILPLVAVVTSIINHLIGLGVVFAILLLFTGKLTPQTPFILIYLFFISIFAVGLGWMLSSLNVYARDVKQVLTLLIRAWFFFTPIFWSVSRVPDWVASILKYNPMFVMVDAYRHLLLAGRMPPAGGLVYLGVVSFIFLAAGGVFFRKLKPGFAEVL
jgi:ABC-type polysaccharide/polyol phosphate export permease